MFKFPEITDLSFSFVIMNSVSIFPRDSGNVTEKLSASIISPSNDKSHPNW